MVKEIDFKDIRVGDRVMIVSEWVADERGNKHWNPEGKMDHHLGTVMTVRRVSDDRWLYMEEDKYEFIGGGWIWSPEMIAGLWVDEEFDSDTSEWPQDVTLGLF